MLFRLLIFHGFFDQTKFSEKGGFFPDGRPAIGTQQTFLSAHTKCLQVPTKVHQSGSFPGRVQKSGFQATNRLHKEVFSGIELAPKNHFSERILGTTHFDVLLYALVGTSYGPIKKFVECQLPDDHLEKSPPF